MSEAGRRIIESVKQALSYAKGEVDVTEYGVHNVDVNATEEPREEEPPCENE